jgi:hypothetical protein
MKSNRTRLILIYLVAGLSIAVLGSGDIAHADTTPKTASEGITDAQLEKLKLEIQELKNKDKEAITKVQLEKLNLEVQGMKNKDSLADKIPQYLPLITTLIAVGGFCFTIYQFFLAQNKDRLAKEQGRIIQDENQIRTNLEQLLSLDPEKQASVGRVFFLLGDLNTLAERNPIERQKITDSLVEFIKNDCNFDILRHIRIDLAAMQLWPDYVKYLTDDPETQDFILYKYVQALRHVHDEDATYFEAIEYHDDGFRVKNFTDEGRYLRFMSLVTGYASHIKMLKEDSTVTEAIEKFQEALNNARLTKQLIDSQEFPAPENTSASQSKPFQGGGATRSGLP